MTRTASTCALLLLALWARAGSAQVLELQPGVARPGDAVLVTVRGAGETPQGSLGGRALRFHAHRGAHRALAGLPVELAPGTLELEISVPSPEGEVALAGSLEVVEPNFNARELTVSKKFISPPKRVRRQIAQDRAAFAKAFAQAAAAPLFAAGFEWPKLGVRTAPYGDLRMFNGKKKSQHFGTDLDGKVGDPLYAANDGKVVMVRDCYASGGTVLVHHGAELYTAYFHLSSFAVKPGARVRRGQKLGAVGATGRVTGPHLHWGVKVGGLWVDPESLLRLRFD